MLEVFEIVLSDTKNPNYRGFIIARDIKEAVSKVPKKLVAEGKLLSINWVGFLENENQLKFIDNNNSQ